MAEGRRDTLTGSGVTRGIAIGRAHLLARSELEVRQYTIERRDVVHEIGRLTSGFNAVRTELDTLKSNIAAEAPGEVRACVAACCAYCEARRVAYTPQPVVRYRVAAWA